MNMKKTKTQTHRVLPGFGLTLGFTLTYLSLLVLIPLTGLLLMTARLSWSEFFHKAILDPRVLAAYRLSFTSSLIAAMINVVFGFIVAWVLVRYRFPGKRIVDSIVDLPFALPTAVRVLR
jgi:sulfate transport system permease protein